MDKQSPLTPLDAKKKVVNEILKHVDALTKDHDYAKAFLEVLRAKTMDPKNPYVQAYEERLAVLIDERKRKEHTPEPKKQEVPPEHPPRPEQHSSSVPPHVKEPSQQNAPIRPAAKGLAATKGGREMLIHTKDHHTPSVRSTVLLLDDDKDMLAALSETIESNGFDTVACVTTDDAFRYFESGSLPDIIVCDINLTSSSIGGFSFYEKIRQDEKIASIPFIFLSGLSDDVVIRTGKELGADDYLTKPVSEDMLISTIKGKLKRFQGLKRSSRSRDQKG